MYFNLLQARQQQKDEDFSSFAEEIDRLASFAYLDETEKSRDRFACLQFITGLKDPRIETILRSERIESLQIAVQRATELQSIHNLVNKKRNITNSLNFQNQNQNRTTNSSSNPNNSKITSHNSSSNPSSIQTPQQHNFQKSFHNKQTVTCFACGKLGHFNYECKNPASSDLNAFRNLQIQNKNPNHRNFNSISTPNYQRNFQNNSRIPTHNQNTIQNTKCYFTQNSSNLDTDLNTDSNSHTSHPIDHEPQTSSQGN